MSKIWKSPILLPEGVTAKIANSNVSVTWPKWELNLDLHQGIDAELKDNAVVLSCNNVEKNSQYRGTMRSLVFNMIEWVSEGYTKKLQVIGVGFDATTQGNLISLKLGYAHAVEFAVPQNIDVQIDKNPKGDSIITLSSADKQLIGQTAAKLRALRVPEPYKGKGIRYADEYIKLKPGKAAATWKE